MEDDGAYLNQNVCIKPIYHTHTTIVCYRHTSALSLPYLAFPASTYLPSPFSFNHSISIQILHSSPRYNILFNNVPHKFSRTLESCLSLQLPSSQLFCLRFCFCFCFCLTPIKRHSRQNKIKLPVVQQATFITLVYAFLAVSHSLFPSLCYLLFFLLL